MKFPFGTLLVLIAVGLALPELGSASVVFKPGQKAKYVAPGDEEMNGNAQQLFTLAQEAEKKGDIGRAIKAYRTLVKRHSKDMLAPGAVYRMAQLLEQKHDYLRAAEGYVVLVQKFPKSERFDEAIEALFRIGEMYLSGQKIKILGIPVKPSMNNAADIFAAVVRAGPFGKYAARAQFNIGLAREKEGANDAAIAAYQTVVEKFPNDPLAADAQYQIGYIWSKAARSGTNDPNAAAKAKTGFQDFLFRHPNSEKAAQARENVRQVEHKQTASAFEIAKFYDKKRSYRAAVIYYNDVIRQQPGSTEGDRAKKRVEQLRAKVGDAALQPPAVTAATANKKNKKSESADNGPPAPGNQTLPSEAAPLPPPDADISLPPPASLLPDTTTAPASSLPAFAPSPEPSAPPETSAAPEATAPPN
jgi:outer membrane protein assembly factor BamD